MQGKIFMDEALKVFDDEVNFVCKKLKVPPRLRYRWDDSWDVNLEKIFQDYDKRVIHSIKCRHIEEKTEKYLESFAKSFDNSELFWTKYTSDPSMCQGASYVQIECLKKDDVYANTELDIEIEDAYKIKKDWFVVENKILEELKESGFFIITRKQLKQPITFEFDKENPLHIGILSGMLDSNLYRSQRDLMLYDFFFSWID